MLVVPPIARYLGAALAIGVCAAGVASAHPPDIDGVGDGAGGGVVETVFNQHVHNIPGKSVVALEVSYAPGAKDLPHRHAGSSFIMAYVVSGAIRSQVEGEPSRVYQAGETWQEDGSDYHVVAENSSATEPAKLLAVFVVDSGQAQSLTTVDSDSER
jgi:quercetin dioxygenase-like cupin family protein